MVANTLEIIEVELLRTENGIYTFRKDKDNFIKFSPERGGIITNWFSNNCQILYFDEKRFLNTTKSIRGGIPVLFPICGNLDKCFSFGKNYKTLMQHGFARNLNWNFSLNKIKNSLCLSLKDNNITRQYYPYSFEIEINYFLEIESLSVEINVLNKSPYEMPINFGLHPYFNISDYKNIKFVERSNTCQNQLNNSLEQTDDLLKNLQNGIDLLMYTSGRTSFKDFGFNRKISLINPAPFDICVLWTDPPRKMICMEPWTSPRNSFATGIKKIDIPANSSQQLSASIKIDHF